jgi:hypothetical protein
MELHQDSKPFSQLIFQSFAEASKEIAANPERVPSFIEYLFYLKENNQEYAKLKSAAIANHLLVSGSGAPLHITNTENFNSEMTTQLILTWCTWIICAGMQPQLYLNEIKSKSKPRVCTKVWNDGYYFYRCRNCERSPSR